MGENWDRTAAASCIRGDEKAAIQLKQILDAKEYLSITGTLNTPDYVNDGGKVRCLLDARL